MIPNIYQCEFCSSTFVTEKGYKAHNCKYMKRYEYVTKRPKGVSSYNYYLKWLRESCKSTKYVDQHTFIHSTQYNHFQNFLSMCKEQGIPDRDVFIKIMCKKKISPQHWCREEVIQYFLETYDTDIDPIKHLDKTVDTVLRLTEALECPTSELFNNLDNDIMLTLIKTRKLSPWVLLNSKKFKEYLLKRASAKEREYIQKYINPAKWNKIISNNPKMKKMITVIIEEFGL